MPNYRTYPASEPASYFEQMAGPEKGRTHELARERMSIGRTLDNDIVLPSEAVSRCHAYLIREGSTQGDRWRIQDNGSKNGVLVNGVLVRERLLASGDIVQVGNYIFRYQVPAAFGYGSSGAHRAPYSAGAATEPAFRIPQRSAMPDGRNRIFLYTAIIFSLVALGFLGLWRSTRVAPTGETAAPASPGGAKAAVIAKVIPPAEPRAVAEIPRAIPVPEEPRPDTSTRQVPMREAPSSPEPAPEPRKEAPKPVVLTPPSLPVKPPPKLDEKQEIEKYLSEGVEYLRRGEFENAAAAFHFAIVIDPENGLAMKGIKAAEYKKRDVDEVKLDKLPAYIKVRHDPRPDSKSKRRNVASANPVAEVLKVSTEKEKKDRVTELFLKARDALAKNAYSEVIQYAEEVRKIELKGDPSYLNEAKQVIDKARTAQREEYEPFVLKAKELQSAGDWSGSLDLCEEMLKRDPGYGEARDCAQKARAKLAGKDKDK